MLEACSEIFPNTIKGVRPKKEAWSVEKRQAFCASKEQLGVRDVRKEKARKELSRISLLKRKINNVMAIECFKLTTPYSAIRNN